MSNFMEKWTAIYARSPEDVEKLKKFCESRKFHRVRKYVGQGEFRRLLQDVRQKNVHKIVVHGLDQFPCGAAALLKQLGHFADQNVVWYDAKNNLSTGIEAAGHVKKFIEVLRHQDAKKGNANPDGRTGSATGRLRP